MRYYFLKPIRPAQPAGTPVLSVSPASLTLDRTAPGNVATFTASLNLDSGSAVAVSVTSSDPSVTVSPTAFPLGGGNPLTRTVTVTGAAAGPDAVSLTVTAPGQTTRIIGISRPQVPLDLTVTPTSLVLDRVSPGNVGTFTAALNRVPESSVSVSVSSSDPSVTVSPASFSLITGNPPSQTITLTGNATGPSPVTISVNPVSLTAKTVSVTRTAFTPAAIPGLALWLDANDSATLTLDGSSNVSQWLDKGPNAYPFVQISSAKRPKYLTNVINGLPVVRTDSVDDVLTAAGIPVGNIFGSGGTTFTAIYFGQRVADTGRTFASLRMASNERFEFDHDIPSQSAAHGLLQTTVSAQFVVTAPFVSTQRNIVSYFWSSGGQFNLRRYMNGAAIVYPSGIVTGSFTKPVDAHIGEIGLRPQAPYDFAEVAIYNRVLTASEIGSIEAYLVGKWGTI